MKEERWGIPEMSATERLASLRPAASPRAERPAREPEKKISREVLFGVVLILLGLLVGLVLLSRGTTQVAEDTVTAASVPQESALAQGEYVVAALVNQGAFPPLLGRGMQVRLVVSSTRSTDDAPRMLPGTATVDAVDPAGDMSASSVVTLRTGEETAREVAAADEVRLVLVGGDK